MRRWKIINTRTAVITGASSGIGEATARALHGEGFTVILAARRIDRLAALANELGSGARAMELDVTDAGSVAALATEVARCDVLVNNAGGAKGLVDIAAADIDDWRWMYETNVLGTVRMTRAMLPALRRSGDGHVVVISSVAGHEVYPGGAGYTAAKHAQAALTDTLRMELVAEPIRVTEICPGLVETEFSLVRFDGDAEAAAKPYAGITPLIADDIADCVTWAVTRPSNVSIDRIDVKPRAQATATLVHRTSE
ncbi:MAG TPA: SDR family NAD(P)-dependent oxidoreductase [Mycobacteriales bacterium]|nr:SDR family NAD(P)-dependent oxidoreductase [Mycobacteriales bacterium]